MNDIYVPIYVDGLLKHTIKVEFLENVCHDTNNYWYEVVNFGMGKENITGEIEIDGNGCGELIRILMKKVK